jgi:hypothetical protein
LYTGKVSHRLELYDGEHDAIIDAHAWNEVQQLLATNRRERLHGQRARSPSLLTGLIYDADRRPMTPVFTTKGSRQHRYYVTRLNPGQDRSSAWRVPAGDIDRAILECTSKFLTRRAAEELDAADHAMPTDLARLSVPEQRKVLRDASVVVQLGSSAIIVSIGSEPQEQLPLPARYARRGNEMKLVVSVEGPAREPDKVLLKLLAHASAAREAITTGTRDPMMSNYSKRHYWQLLRLNWLAPDIITAIVEGRQPASMTGRSLLRAVNVPLSWEDQRRYFSFS